MKNQKDIEYLDATPAAGKTREARMLMAKHIETKGKGIFVYAAPTHNLLDEVTKSLRDAIGIDAYERHVYRIDPTESPTTVYNCLMGLESLSTLRDRESEDVVADVIAVCPRLRIVLCTHECMIRAPKLETPQTAGATVIFDEARNCVLQDIESRISVSSIERIASVFKFSGMKATKKDVLIDGNTFTSSLACINKDGFPTTQKLMQTFEVTELKDLPAYVLSLFKMKKLCEGGRADVLVEILRPTKKSVEQVAYFIGLSRPSRIFEGYGRVIVMSAYFSHSQMYHLLLNAHVGHQNGDQIFRLVQYKSSTSFKARSKFITENAIKNIRIGAMLKTDPNKKGGGKLTSTFLSTGLMVPSALRDTINKKVTVKKSELISSAFKGKPLEELTAEENAELQKCATPPLFYLQWIAYNVFRSNNVDHALCFTNAQGGSAGAVYRVDKRVIKTVRLLTTRWSLLVTKEYDELRSSVTQMDLDRIQAAESFFTIPKSTSVLGLNAYDGIDGFVHLAALNPKPAVARALKRVLPNYDPDLDYAISNIIQTMFRTSLRRADSKTPVFCMVLTDWIIEQIERVCFNGKTLTRITNYNPDVVALDYTSKSKDGASRGGKKSGETRKLKVPDDVREKIRAIQNHAGERSHKVLMKKALILREIGRTYPETQPNIRRWFQKYGITRESLEKSVLVAPKSIVAEVTRLKDRFDGIVKEGTRQKRLNRLEEIAKEYGTAFPRLGKWVTDRKRRRK